MTSAVSPSVTRYPRSPRDFVSIALISIIASTSRAGWPSVNPARPDGRLACILLQRMREPARRAGYREDRFPGAPDQAGHVGQRGEREVDVRLWQRPAAGLGEHRVGHR